MEPAERFIEAATAPLAETNAELHLAAQHELRERIDPSDSEALEAAALRLETVKRFRWVKGLLILTGVVSLAVIVPGYHQLRLIKETASIIRMVGPTDTAPIETTLDAKAELLLYGDRSKPFGAEQFKALWDSQPNNPVYFADYAIRYAQDNDALPPDFLKTAEDIDPDNGWFWLIAAAVESEGSVEEDKQEETERAEKLPPTFSVIDQSRYDSALEKLKAAASKPRFTSYSTEILVERIPHLTKRVDWASLVPAIGYVASGPIATSQLISLDELIGAELQRCASDNDVAGYRDITGVIHQLVEGLIRGSDTLIDVMISKKLLQKWAFLSSDTARILGIEDDAAKFQELSDRFVSERAKLKAASGKESDFYRLIQQKGSIFSSLTIPMLERAVSNPLPITNDDLRPGRRADHALTGRLFAVGSWITLGISLAAVTAYQARHGVFQKTTAKELTLLLTKKDWIWIIGAGVIFPAVWFWTIAQLSPLAAHEWSIMATRFAQSSGQFSALIYAMIIGPVVFSRWRLGIRTPFLKNKQPSPFIGLLVFTLTLAAIPLIGAIFYVEAYSQNLLLLGSGFLMVSQLWLLVVIIRALFGRPQKALSRQVVARLTMPAYAVAMLISILAAPLFYQMEKHWIAKDRLMEVTIEAPSMNRYEYQVAQQLKSELLGLLEELP